ncbi:hypothetical protein, partial [Klebsiella aerogenes]|uniref:hypothetical protein n=1 Tax=Klebsiella aerogenes TaxID=548 RepID=UPI00254CADD8
RLDRANDISYLLFTVARGLGVSTLARISRAHAFAACKVHWTLRLSGSANRSDFSRIMQLEIVDSRYALSEKAGRRALKISQLGHHLINANIS